MPSPQAIGRRFERRALALEAAVIKAEKKSMRRALTIAHRWSSGRYSTATLVKMGHPYARRNPHPPQDPSIINRQTGVFWAAWRVIGPEVVGDRLKSRLVNEAPYAYFLDKGTRTMIARPILSRVMAELQPERRRRHAAAISAVLRDQFAGSL